MDTGSDAVVNINLSCPSAWSELTQEQLAFVFSLLASGHSFNEIKTLCFFKWNGLKVVAHKRNRYLIRMKKTKFIISPPEINAALTHMAWVESMPVYPVRLDRVGKNSALPEDFQGVSFENYLCCENMYQGYLATKDEAWLNELGCILYDCKSFEFTPMHRVNIFYWFASLKLYLSAQFPTFFQPADSSSDGGTNPVAAMNAQIRALTKGDITKEALVLSMDCWRALAELEAQAKEYEEMKKIYKS